MHHSWLRGARARRVALRSVIAITLIGCGSALGAQQPLWPAAPIASIGSDATIGSPSEHTTLILRLLGISAPASEHRALRVTPIWVANWVNTARANPDRDGAVWQGRGLTASGTGGVVADWRFAALSLRPIVYVAQNARYLPATPNGGEPPTFANPFYNGSIDLPYRFGDGAIGRLMPGESWIRLGPRMAHVGFSTAGDRWGPAHAYPLVMSTEGPGYPRLFGAVRELPLYIGKASGRWDVGRLEGSPYAAHPPESRSRLATSLTATFAFGGPLEGLAVGASRFFHIRWEPGNVTWNNATLPFAGLLKQSNPTNEVENTAADYNQLASLYARIAPPNSGVEAYGELYREDHNQDFRDLAEEPDHESAYTIGLRRAWRSSESGVSAVTIESMNGRITHLMRVRGESPMYIHSIVSEGHTYLGQPLGSIAAFGGAGTYVAFDHVERDVATSVEAELRQTVQNREGGTYSGQLAARIGGRFARIRTMGRSTRGWWVGVDSPIGLERGFNVSLGAILGLSVDSRPTDRVK